MTAKQKAEQLVEKYSLLVDDYHRPSKQCALLAANEVVDVLISNAIDAENEKLLLYWNRVIEEIEKL